MSDARAAPAERRLLPCIWLGAILLAVAVAYANALGGVMLYDDIRGIVEDQGIRQFPRVLLGTSRPLTDLTFHLNYRLGGVAPYGYHLVNIAVHGINAALLFSLLAAAMASIGSIPRSRAVAMAGATALVWAVHPLATESVTYIVQRGESLMALCLLAALRLSLAAARTPRSRCLGVAAIAACAGGMLAKPVMVAAPWVILVTDAALAGGTVRDAWRRRRTFYAALFATLVIPVVLSILPNESATSAGLEAGLPSPPRYLLTQATVIVHYLALVVAPWPLCLDYGWPEATWREALPAGVSLLVLAALAIVAYRRRHASSAIGAWFFLLLAPSSSVFPLADAAAEHRMYLPLAAPILLGVLGAARLWDRVSVLGIAVRQTVRWALVAAGAIVVGALMLLTHARNADYRSGEIMWRRVVACAPWNLRARFGLGSAILARGDVAGAEAHFRDVLAGLPSDALASPGPVATLYSLTMANLGVVRVRQERYENAEACFREAMRVARGNTHAAMNLASLLVYKGDRDGAVRIARGVLGEEPGHAEARALLDAHDRAHPDGDGGTTRSRGSAP